jgi:7-cyano-7-deazaguanine synthase
LDSSILLGYLLAQGLEIQPFYIRSGLLWESEELAAACEFLAALAPHDRLRQLVVLELPLSDLYTDHWSITGQNIPGAASPDEAVYLPGRNALLMVKAALWCQLHGIRQLALGVLGTSPFADATAEFFEALQSALNCNQDGPICLLRPFDGMDKGQVMKLGHDLPLEHTFSCIAPQGGLHCGQCNKCAERQAAFALLGRTDPTPYAMIQAT